MNGELFAAYCEEHEDSAEVTTAVKNAVASLGNLIPDVEDILTHIGYLYEKQGFSNGYQCAMERRRYA